MILLIVAPCIRFILPKDQFSIQTSLLVTRIFYCVGPGWFTLNYFNSVTNKGISLVICNCSENRKCFSTTKVTLTLIVVGN